MESRFSKKSNKYGQTIDRGLIREIRELQKTFGAKVKDKKEVSKIKSNALGNRTVTSIEEQKEIESN